MIPKNFEYCLSELSNGMYGPILVHLQCVLRPGTSHGHGLTCNLLIIPNEHFEIYPRKICKLLHFSQQFITDAFFHFFMTNPKSSCESLSKYELTLVVL